MSQQQPTPTNAGHYDFTAIEAKWQNHWQDNRTFSVDNPGTPGFDETKPKRYVLDMFPYPSGAGLHVGHPLGYCATDIYSRYSRMKGFNVLHPMGYDAFGLPAEQYAVETGVHPAVTTEKNIANMRRQLKMFGFSYDWNREMATCTPDYYKHTQWIFLQMYNAWYDEECIWIDPSGRETKGRARHIDELVSELQAGKFGIDDALEIVRDPAAAAHKWSDLSEDQRGKVIDQRRLAFIGEVPVNWCPALGTVLANEEVTNEGRSDRGNHPVFRKPLHQWMLRITSYAERLLADLELVDWPEPIKLMQRNWIGRSTGAEVDFPIASGGPDAPTVGEYDRWRNGRQGAGYPAKPEEFVIRVYTTRPDTLYGATYMVLAPEHPLVAKITTEDQRQVVSEYVQSAQHKSDLDRAADTKEKTGVFTGAYAINPVNEKQIPIWVADYVMMGYGTGAIMAVPGHDTRDFEFAKVFQLPIEAVVLPDVDWLTEQLTQQRFDRDYADRTGRAGIVDAMVDGMVSTANTLNYTALNALTMLDGDPAWTEQVAVPFFTEHCDLLMDSFTGEGTAVNSDDFDGMPTAQFKKEITEALVEAGLGKGAVNYKLRDWVFTRQRYWGEPFPILHGPDGRMRPLDESELPLALPEVEDYKPTVSHDENVLPEPPLGRATQWKDVEIDGVHYSRDLNTMPQWAGSCWYYLRFIDPGNDSRFCSSDAEKYWMPVDTYVGGAEHAVLHLLYARFWHKVLFDFNHVTTAEPFKNLINQGMIQSFAYKDKRGVIISMDLVEEKSGKFFNRETAKRLLR